MSLAVCTLFENEYYKGVTALINSLYRYGFKGNVYVGLPKAKFHQLRLFNIALVPTEKEFVKIFPYSNSITIKFLGVDNGGVHLANYKPYFLEEILDLDRQIDGLFYFDPDIVINYEWNWFEMWIEQGIPVVHEIINSDMSGSHPLRCLWRKVIYLNGLGEEHHHLLANCNSGFLGVKRSQRSFLDKWKEIMNLACQYYGKSMTDFIHGSRTQPFRAMDQDAFNIALMVTPHKISEMGPEAMGFTMNGLQVMLHATGRPKPWQNNFIFNALKGLSPSMADKGFLLNSEGIMHNYTPFQFGLKQILLKISILINRFYRKENI